MKDNFISQTTRLEQLLVLKSCQIFTHWCYFKLGIQRWESTSPFEQIFAIFGLKTFFCDQKRKIALKTRQRERKHTFSFCKWFFLPTSKGEHQNEACFARIQLQSFHEFFFLFYDVYNYVHYMLFRLMLTFLTHNISQKFSSQVKFLR